MIARRNGFGDEERVRSSERVGAWNRRCLAIMGLTRGAYKRGVSGGGEIDGDDGGVFIDGFGRNDDRKLAGRVGVGELVHE